MTELVEGKSWRFADDECDVVGDIDRLIQSMRDDGSYQVAMAKAAASEKNLNDYVESYRKEMRREEEARRESDFLVSSGALMNSLVIENLRRLGRKLCIRPSLRSRVLG